MAYQTRRILVSVVAGLAALASGLSAQAPPNSDGSVAPPPRAAAPNGPAPNTPMPAPPGGAANGVSESRLGPIYVRDQNGATVVYPSITLEEIERLLEREQQLRAAQPPKFIFSPGTTIRGQVTGSVAELEVQLQVQLTKAVSSDQDWVRIPFRLNQAILIPPVAHRGDGEFQIEFDPDGDGYVAWLRASPGSTHAFTMQLRAQVQSKNGVRQLSLTAPDSPTTSFQVSVPGSGTEARVNGNMGNILTTRKGEAGRTELVVDAAGGLMELSWRELTELPPVLAAFGNILISLEGRQLEFDAQLNVRSYGPPIDSFIVRLPPGTELIATNQFTQPGLEYTVLPEVPSSASSPAGQGGTAVSATSTGPMPPAAATASGPTSANSGVGRRVLVRRKEGKTAGLIEARFRCHATRSVLDSPAPWQLAGFEVLDAKHQKGTIDFQVDGDWTIDWLPDANVRQVDDLPDVLRQQRLAARFEYDRQPFSLQAAIREKKTRISVEPVWIVSVESRRLVLNGILSYRISGARAKPLEIDTGGWQIQQVGPEELLNGNWQVENHRLIVPLSTMVQNTAGEFELTVRAVREASPLPITVNPLLPPLSPGSLLRTQLPDQPRPVAFPLPRPVSDAGLPALVVITPDDNVELTPQTEQSRRLVSDTLPPEISLPAKQQQPLVYREDVAGEPAVFIGQYRVRPQAITVAADSRLRLDDREVSVEQRFSHTVLYDPLKRLRYWLPITLAESGRFELLVDGVAATWTREPSGEGGPAEHVPIGIDLRDPRLGECEVVFRHRHPRKRAAERTPSTLAVPLVQVPTDATTTLKTHRLRILPPSNLAVTVPSEPWTPATTDSGTTSPGELWFQSNESPPKLALNVAVSAGPAKRSTDVHRVWVQTLLTEQERRERACFRLTTNEHTLTFRLPPGVEANDLTVAVNGQRSDRFNVIRERELRVELGESLGAREITIEIWYWFSGTSVPIGRLALQAPGLDGTVRADRVYWQLMMPHDEHLAWHPAVLISENAWEWRGLGWARRPRRTQAELEQWVSASVQPDLHRELSSGFNTYLFSSVGSLQVHHVYTMTRQLALLSLAGVVLVMGTGLLYVPALRHPLLLLVAGVALTTSALLFPEPALAAAQWMAIGLGLVAVTGLLMALFSRPTVTRAVVRTTSQLTTDSRASKQPSVRGSANSHITTATLQASVPMPVSGNES